jgi:hypothetical protein
MGNVLRILAVGARVLANTAADKEKVETVIDIGSRIYAHAPTICPCCHGKGKVSRQKAMETEMALRKVL